MRALSQGEESFRVYALSIDKPEQSRDFAQKIAADGKGAVDFPLLSDPEHRVIDGYGLRDPAYAGQQFDGIPRPSVYVIDKAGRVAWAKVEEDYKQRPTSQEIRAALAALK